MVDNKQVDDRQSVMLISYFCICEIVEFKVYGKLCNLHVTPQRLTVFCPGVR